MLLLFVHSRAPLRNLCPPAHELIPASVAGAYQIPDAVVAELVTARLAAADCGTQGWVLDGAPGTRSQAEAIHAAGFVPNRVFTLQVRGWGESSEQRHSCEQK